MKRRLAGAVGGVPDACVTPIDCPPILSVAVRVLPVFAVTDQASDPEPVRVALAIVIHAGMPVGAQLHAPVVTTEKLPEAASGETDRLAGVIVYVQAPGWVAVNVRPAMVAVPMRWVVAVLRAAVTATVPLPVPPAPAGMVIHAALLAAVHGHVLAVVTVTVSTSPPALTVLLVGVMA